MDDLIITDTRPSEQILHRDIMPSSLSRKLALEFDAQPNGDGTLVIQVDSPKVAFIPDFLFSFRDLIMRCFDRSLLSKAAHSPYPLGNPEKPAAPVLTDPMAPSLSYRITVTNAEFSLLQDASQANSNAMVLSVGQFVMAQEHILSLAAQKLGFGLCTMDDRSHALNIIQPLDLTFILDTRPTAVTNLTVDVTQMIIFRISYHDIMVVLDIIGQIMTSAGAKSDDLARDAFNKTHSVFSQIDLSLSTGPTASKENVTTINVTADGRDW
jgi:vacuolar protein sorting-associated protein 13A/C